MCGVWGFFSHFSSGGLGTDELKLMNDMLIVGAQRGKDGAGVVGIHQNGDVEWVKKEQNPYHLMYSKEYVKFFNDMKATGRIFFGHNRSATRGTISTDNTHPFQHGDIIMIHNGTLTSGVKIKKDGTDSEALCKLISTDGIEAALQQVYGAWTLVYYDVGAGTVNLVTNGDRPLALYKSDGGSYAWASRDKMLEWLLTEHKNYSGFKPVAIKKDHLYTLKAQPAGQILFEEKQLAGKKYVYPVTNYQSASGSAANHPYACGWGDCNSDWDYGEINTPTATPVSPTPPPDKVVSFPPGKRGNIDDYVQFQVLAHKRKEQAKGNFLFEIIGLSDRGEGITALSHKNSLDKYPIGEWYESKIVGRIVNAQGVYYQVKHRDMKPIDPPKGFESTKDALKQEVENAFKASDSDPMFTFGCGSQFPESQVDAILEKDHGCMSCAATISLDEVEQCLAITDGSLKLIGIQCPECADKWRNNFANFYMSKRLAS